MKHLKIISLLLVLFFAGCENEELLNPEISYQEKLVVQCQFYADINFPGVIITKTLPLEVEFDIKLAEIKDATLYLRVNGFQIIPLHYISDGLYKPLYDFRPKEGDYYELFGEWNEYNFYALTKVPLKPVINNVNFNSTGYFAEAGVTAFKDEVYSALWAVDLGHYKTADDFYNISVPPANSTNYTINVRSAAYPVEYQSAVYNGRRYMQIYSFDSSFDAYFKTKVQNEEINNPYVQGSGNTVWNVKGENVIGMFIGLNKSNFIFIN
ncbi:MAG TPA: hypothetical protein VF870_05765 [Ignavibacteriaceae bacterium]